jgi:biopolymer transport protein ExbD
MKRYEQPQVEMQIAPLIDVCFLLLFFYILTSKPTPPEGGLGISLPGTVSQAESINFPDEQRVEILETGAIVLNDECVAPPESKELPKLRRILVRYREGAEANKERPMITLAPADGARHQRIIDVLSVCANAGISQISFAGGEAPTP